MFAPPIFILLVMISLLSHGIQSAPPYVYHTCSNRTTSTHTSTLQANLSDTLFTMLSFNTTAVDINNGFFYSFASVDDKGSVLWQVQSSTTVIYSSYLCRGDVSTDTCTDCVSYATKDIVARCPRSVEAVIWYDECTVRYSDTNIFGFDQEDPHVFIHNTMNISNPNQLAQFLANTMNGDMAAQAASDTSGKKFVTKQVKLSSFEMLYSLVQCTPDLPEADCVRCIQTGVSNFPNGPNGAAGARALLPNCVVRYEIYPFYNFTAVTTLVPPPLPPKILTPFTSNRTNKGKTNRTTKVIVGIIVPVAVLAFLLVAGMCILLTNKAKKKSNGVVNNVESEAIVDFTASAESLQYDFSELQSGTNNFSDANKLGQGGFGGVYRGKLKNGHEIAVKRLSENSGQGVQEFNNEIVLVAKLKHRNLVRLMGFCLEGNENLLVYEYVPNKSLDYFLSDPEKQVLLDWTTRYKIIGGIARGMLYLHEDSRLKIIHRDLKPSNILLDTDMIPKISDFGMAKIFCIEQSQGNTNRVVGTYGYMAPEYAFLGEFSVKSDVYSFGVLVLEIIRGQKINDFHKSGYAEDLISYAWKKWNENEPVEFMDRTLRDGTYPWSEVTRCIHLGLLCVQEEMEARPNMSTVVMMLSSESVTLPMPKNPAFYSPTSRTGGLMRDQASNCNSKTSLPASVNDISITEVDPR